MNRTLFTALAFGVTLVAASANADTSDPTNYTPPTPAEAPTARDAIPQKLALHLDPIAFVPIGSLGDVTGIGAGVMGGVEIRLSPNVSLTGRGGYISSFEQRTAVGSLYVSSSIDAAPFLGGVKWYVFESQEGFFFGGEAGPVLAIGSSRVQGGVAGVTAPIDVAGSGSATHLGGAASLGYQAGSWDLRAGLLTLDLGHPDRSSGVMMSVAYNFAQF